MTVTQMLGIKSKSIETTLSAEQDQTKTTFGFKWNKTNSYDSDAMNKMTREWLLKKYFRGDEANLRKIFGEGGKIFVDAGCGSGYSASMLFGEALNENLYLGIDISNSVDAGRERFSRLGLKGEFLQIGLEEFDPPTGSIDIIFSEGVLHHTDSTEKSFKHLANKVKPGGYFVFYVYAKKAVIREFSDDFIREELKPLSDEEAWAALYSLTKLGKSLGELNLSINVEEDIPFLGIKKGEIDIQRFFYWNIAKLFYREEFSLEEMNHINFDWYRPLNCHRHTPEEVMEWCREAGFIIRNITVEESGISVVAEKNL